jgi:hypothetical protein
MYFQLNNIPLWRGAYMILKVSHNITAGNMVTSFEGVRVSRYAMPMSTGAAAIYTRDAEDKKSDKSEKLEATRKNRVSLNLENLEKKEETENQ